MAEPPAVLALPPAALFGDLPPYADAREAIRAATAEGFRSTPTVWTSDWADAKRRLAEGTSPEYGPWRTARTPYLRDIMNALSPQHPARRVVFVKGSRLGATECGNNWIGRSIDVDRRSIMMFLPSLALRKEAMRDRIDPMIASTPALRARVLEGQGRNTLEVRTFEGCKLHVRYASSTKQFKGHGAPYLFCDEIDDWPRELGRDGSPLELAEKRIANYRGAKIYYCSTPTERDFSAIETLYQRSNQQRYFLRCPDCGHWDFLTWQGFRDYLRRVDGGHYEIKWDSGKPETARAVCPVDSCRCEIPESHKTVWFAEPNAEWRATAPGDGETWGFHLPSYYSPLGWVSWAELALDFEHAHPEPNRLRVWVNERAAETFEERDTATANEDELLRRREEPWPAEIPAGVGVLTASADIHADRIEAQVLGVGADEESWVIATEVWYCDPRIESSWKGFDQWLLQPFQHEKGRIVYIERALVDARYLPDAVYRFTGGRESREVAAGWIQQVYAVVGVGGGQPRGKPIVDLRATRANRYRAARFVVNADGAKDLIFARLRIPQPGPGYVHLPDWIDRDYVEQLLAEKAKPNIDKKTGRRTRIYVSVRPNNHKLDLTVYDWGALYLMGAPFVASLADRAREWASPPAPGPAGPDAGGAPPVAADPRRAWVMGFKRGTRPRG